MNDRIIMHDLPLSGLKLIKRSPITDKRGSLQRVYCSHIFNNYAIDTPLNQINLTHTPTAGIIRGMHFQHAPYAEIKVVTCLRGKIFDVAVDLRENSPTFLKWHGEILSPELHNSLLIPKGFAHGYQTLTDDCELLYFHTSSYHPQSEGGIFPMDTMINVSWPMALTDISDRDNNHPLLTIDFKGLPHAL